MKVSISRSVGRAFAIMELFKQTRQPASATQLSRRLDAPHSSVVAVLHNLRDLGYLGFNQTDMTYFPTAKLSDLAGWKRPAPPSQAQLAVLLDRVARDTAHLTVLSSRVSLFVNTVATRPGKFTAIAPAPRSVGTALVASIPGLAILAQLDDAEVQEIVRDTEAWLRDTGGRKAFDNASIFAAIETIRRRGIITGAHPACRSTEIMACPVKMPQGTAFSIAVHIPACLSRDAKEDVKQLLETRIVEAASGIDRLPPHPAHLPGLTRRVGFSPPLQTHATAAK